MTAPEKIESLERALKEAQENVASLENLNRLRVAGLADALAHRDRLQSALKASREAEEKLVKIAITADEYMRSGCQGAADELTDALAEWRKGRET